MTGLRGVFSWDIGRFPLRKTGTASIMPVVCEPHLRRSGTGTVLPVERRTVIFSRHMIAAGTALRFLVRSAMLSRPWRIRPRFVCLVAIGNVMPVFRPVIPFPSWHRFSMRSGPAVMPVDNINPMIVPVINGTIRRIGKPQACPAPHEAGTVTTHVTGIRPRIPVNRCIRRPPPRSINNRRVVVRNINNLRRGRFDDDGLAGSLTSRLYRNLFVRFQIALFFRLLAQILDTVHQLLLLTTARL